MTNFVDAWDLRTGQKLDYQIPDTWISNGLAPLLSATDPNTAPPPDDALPPEPPDVAAEPEQDPVADQVQNTGEV